MGEDVLKKGDIMIELAYIIGTAMAVVNTFKSKLPAHVVPLIAVVIAIAMNVSAAYLFGYDPLQAGKDAFVGAGIVVGLFASNDTQSNRTKVNNPEITD